MTQNNSQVLKEELQSNQVKIPFMNWLFEKANLFVPNIKLHSSDQGIFDCNFLVYNEMENILMDKFLFRHSSNSRKLSW